MTDKRFSIVIDETGMECISDIVDCVDRDDFEDIVPLLNKLHEENKQLNEKNQKLNEEVGILQMDLCKTKSYEQLEKDNKRLKQAYSQLRHRHSFLHDECIDAECDRDRYRKDIASLEKENEELKKQLNEYINAFDCGTCRYHNYDWFDDGDEFEVCDKGNNEQQMEYHSCKDWEEL